MKAHLIRASVGITILVGLLGTSACFRHHTPAERADWVTGKIAKHLDLTEQQRAKLDAVKQEMLAARAKVGKERQALIDDAVAQIQEDRLDQAKVLELLERKQALQRQVASQVVPKLEEFHASLTPEQKAKAVEHLRHLQERLGSSLVGM